MISVDADDDLEEELQKLLPRRSLSGLLLQHPPKRALCPFTVEPQKPKPARAQRDYQTP